MMRRSPPTPILGPCGATSLLSSPSPPVARTTDLSQIHIYPCRLIINPLPHLPYSPLSCRPYETAATEAAAFIFSHSLLSLILTDCYSLLWFFFTSRFALFTMIFSSWYAGIFLRHSFWSDPLWYFCSALIRLVFIHLPSLSSNMLCSFPSALPTPLYSLHIRSAQLWLIWSFSTLSKILSWIGSIWISLLRSALSFAPLGLLISLKIAYH